MALASNARGALLALLAFGVYSTHDAVVKTLGGSYSNEVCDSRTIGA